MTRDGRPAQFRRFRASLIDPVIDYWRTSDTSSLETGRRILRDYTAALGHGVNEFEVFIDGWLAPSRSHRLTARTLSKANPGYFIALQRTLRDDVASALATKTNRLGFRVRISARKDAVLPPFRFGATDRSGNLVPFGHSNVEATEAFAQPYARSGVVLVEPQPGPGNPPTGYLDYVGETAKVSELDSRTWLAVLAAENARELYALVDAPSMERCANAVADAVPALGMDPEMADRFTMLSVGSLAEPRSELALVEVRRPRPAEVIGGGVPVMMPVMQRQGAQLRAIPGTTPIPIPEQAWLHLENATLQDGGTILANGELVAYERAADPTLDFVAGQWDSILGSSRRESMALVRQREPAKRHFDSGVVLSGRNDNNWYHWLIEYLPRALQMDESVPDDAPFVVSSRTPQSGIDALSALSSREVLRIDPQLAHRFEVLHVLAPPVQVLDTTSVSWEKGLSLNADPLRAARRIWAGDGFARTERVFLRRRSSHRGLLNEAELVAIAEAHGLTIVDPGQMTWAEQAAMFSTAALVVGASGAVMANYLLMPEGSEVLAITSNPLFDFVLPAAIAHVSGVGFSYVLGRPSTRLNEHANRNSWLHSDFSVRPRHFTSALREAIDRVG